MSTITRIRVGHEAPTAEDVLDYAHALVEQFGYNKMSETGKESDEEVGFTLHDSIGEACTRLSKSTTGSATKDWTVTMTDGDAKDLRAEAQGFVDAELAGVDDKVWNDDPARTQQEVLDLLERARVAAKEANR